MKKPPFYKFFFVLFLFLTFTIFSYQEVGTENFTEEIDPYCNGMDFHDYKNIFQEPPKKISVLIPQSKNYYENLVNASATGNYINQVFKRQFSGTVEINHGGITCQFNAQIRISGDWKDHLNLEKYISSLDVRLTEGNIQGITRFKLFLPRTRNFDNEIFVATILKEYEVLSPRTFNVNVNFNNFYEGNFIFQEKIAKELIENNNLRESLLIESDEYYIWNNTSNPYFRNMDEASKENMFVSGKYLNQIWISKNENNYDIYKSAVGLFNRALFSSKNNKFNLNSEGFNNFEMSKFETLSIALNFNHGVINHNRKFYFDRLSNKFIPIYYDGTPEFLYSPKIEVLNKSIITNKVISAANELKNKSIDIEKLQSNLLANGLAYSTPELRDLLNHLYSNLNLIAAQSSNFESQEVVIKNNFLNGNQEKKAIFSYRDKYLHCTKSVSINCSDFVIEEPSVVNSTITKNTIYFGDFETFFYGSFKKLIKTELNGFSIFSIEKPDYEYDINSNILNLKINNINQRYKLIFSEKSPPLTINLEILETIDSYPANNEFLITGCLTIYNSDFENLKINIKNSFCEDALNIINSSGSISFLNIESSDFDAVDIDYSNIDIEEVHINSADNDCIDLSKGIYKIDLINVSFCGDKGISIGENSKVKFETAYIKDTRTALAVKDYSIVEINNFETVNSESCARIYQKKQEFGPSMLSVKNFICDSDYFVQQGSVLEK